MVSEGEHFSKMESRYLAWATSIGLLGKILGSLPA